ncbi:MAG TPA: serine/threonine-protein kinase [Polyangiaceae bacterium]|nr:serine/threonine-protein kinase [Polyangiaceae bacterium]
MSEPQPEGPLPQLGRYRLIARLGEGGMAQVYLALVRGPAAVAKLFVIKQLRPELACDEEFRAMFLDEVRLAARLSHPNIVQTYEFAEHEGRPIIAMEYLDGQPLHQLLSRVGRATFPLNAHLQALVETLAGLHYAHELRDYDGQPLGIVHRDVSPQNVFVTYDGQVKLMDFGIAKASGSVAVTRAGVVKGKAGYIAPEQITLTETDRRADLFSVGVMLWEALAGRRLTLGMADSVVLYKRAAGGWPSVDELGAEVPAALADICSRAVAFDPADRYPTAKAFRDDLLAYLASVGAPAGAEALGALAGEHFAEERAKIRALVDQELRSARDTGELRSPSMLPSFMTASTVDASVPVHIVPLGAAQAAASGGEWPAPPSRPYGAGGPPSGAPASQAPAGPPPSRAGRAAALAAGLGVFALGAVALARALAPQGGGHGAGAGEAPGAPASAAAPLATASAAATALAAAAVQLSITTKPGDAKVYLDGQLLGQNPFRGIVPHDPTLHRVSVSAPGCDKQERLVSFAEDVALTFALRCRGGGAVARPAPAPGPAPPARPEPGAHLPEREGTRTRPHLQVDEGDPYAK